MPLVWAHAEYVKLRRSLHDGRVFDMPAATVERYLKQKTRGRHVCWQPEQRWRAMPAGKVLRVELPDPAEVYWSSDGWRTTQIMRTRDTGLGLQLADLPTERLPVGTRIAFRFEPTRDVQPEGDPRRIRWTSRKTLPSDTAGILPPRAA